MPSARGHLTRLAVATCGGALLLGAGGCQTTQEKAAEHQAEAARILEARAKRQAKKHADGPKTSKSQTDSAHRPEEGEK